MMRKFTLANLLIFLFVISTFAQKDINIKVHVRNIHQTNISLIALAGEKQLQTIGDFKDVKHNETVNFKVPGNILPCDFLMRFDYKEKKEGRAVASERKLLVSNQDIEFNVNPKYVTNPDSAWFQSSEKENRAFDDFYRQTLFKSEMLSLLEQFLIKYDNPKSSFYKKGVKEYEKRRKAYNQWIADLSERDEELFASSLYDFFFIPKISFTGTELDRAKSSIEHYFDGVDFNDPVITRTSRMNDWMNSYVNLHLQFAIKNSLMDSLVTAATIRAVEHARKGDPLVYGWMVDYFYNGFESNNMPQGMKVLEPYLNDSTCLTSKRMEINRRLKGMVTLVPGYKAPDFVLPTSTGATFQFDNYKTKASEILLVFWSADCQHCLQEIGKLYPWQQSEENMSRLDVIAISLDETSTEIEQWQKAVPALNGWLHLHAKEGINSQIANDYFILSTPVMILIDATTHEVLALPGNAGELITRF